MRWMTMALAAGLAVTPAAGQTLEQRVAGVRDGVVRVTVPARPGVCSWGDGNMQLFRREGAGWRNRQCIPGDLLLELRVREGRVTDIDTDVGASDGPLIPAAQAVSYLFQLAEGGAGDAILPIVAADVPEVHPGLLRLARDASVADDVRRSSVFWLSQLAAEEVTGGLEELAEDRRVEMDVREHVVFALSQRPREEAIAALTRIVRKNPEPRLQARALFWLGQTNDPRAVAIIEEILLRP